jgi:hypothetical protein
MCGGNIIQHITANLKVGCLHPVACTRSGSGFPSNATNIQTSVALDGNPEPDLI